MAWITNFNSVLTDCSVIQMFGIQIPTEVMQTLTAHPIVWRHFWDYHIGFDDSFLFTFYEEWIANNSALSF